MNLNEIELTSAQAQEFLAFLQERVEARALLEVEQEQERQADALAATRYDEVQRLARETAALHSPLQGIPVYDQALMTWEVFTRSEGWFSPLDVDEHFDPSDGEYEDAWVTAYTKVLEAS